MKLYLTFTFLCLWTSTLIHHVVGTDGNIEEFHIHSPNDLNDLAMESLMKYRKEVDSTASFGDDNPMMIKAKDYAVKRFTANGDYDATLNPMVRKLYSNVMLLAFFYIIY